MLKATFALPETKATNGQCLSSDLPLEGSLGSSCRVESKGIQRNRNFNNNAIIVTPFHTQRYICALRRRRRDRSNGTKDNDEDKK